MSLCYSSSSFRRVVQFGRRNETSREVNKYGFYHVHGLGFDSVLVTQLPQHLTFLEVPRTRLQRKRTLQLVRTFCDPQNKSNLHVFAAPASFGLFGAAKDTSAEKKDTPAGMDDLAYHNADFIDQV